MKNVIIIPGIKWLTMVVEHWCNWLYLVFKTKRGWQKGSDFSFLLLRRLAILFLPARHSGRGHSLCLSLTLEIRKSKKENKTEPPKIDVETRERERQDIFSLAICCSVFRLYQFSSVRFLDARAQCHSGVQTVQSPFSLSSISIRHHLIRGLVSTFLCVCVCACVGEVLCTSFSVSL